jgi:signal transduction histidine kinase
MNISGSAVTKAIVAEQVRLLYEGALGSILSSAVLATLLVFLQRDVIGPQSVMLWTALFAVTLAGRVVLVLFHSRAAVGGESISDLVSWLVRYRVGAVAAALVWGLASILLFPTQDLAHQTFLAFTLAGLAAGAMVSLAADPIAAPVFLLAVLAPLAVRLLSEGQGIPLAMGTMVMLYCSFLTVTARRICRDIVQRKQAEKALDDARHQAEAANRAKSVFLSSMSHELRTPLNAILGFGQLLELEDTLDAQQLDYVGEIMCAGRHLLELINGVLDLSKIESGKIELSFEAVDCGALAHDCLPLVSGLATKQGITIESDELGRLVLWGDRARLKQVLLNLMTNAIKYNRPNGKVWLHPMADAKEGRKRLAVSDTGFGIAADKLPMLFQPFSRLGAENGIIEGTGIGLVICQRIVEMMGGSIGVESELGRGSTFWIEMPPSEAIRP